MFPKAKKAKLDLAARSVQMLKRKQELHASGGAAAANKSARVS